VGALDAASQVKASLGIKIMVPPAQVKQALLKLGYETLLGKPCRLRSRSLWKLIYEETRFLSKGANERLFDILLKQSRLVKLSITVKARNVVFLVRYSFGNGDG